MAGNHDQIDRRTDKLREHSWSVNLEQPEHAGDRERLLGEALTAIEQTASGYHVNLVTHGAHGHPESYLYDALDEHAGDAIEYEYIEQCGCGGHVTRVHVEGTAGD